MAGQIFTTSAAADAVTTTATLVQLAAELTLFLVAVAGAGLSIRNGLLGVDRAARLLLALGFLVLGTGAFLVGSLTVDRVEEATALAVLRSAGAALVAFGAVRWAGSRVGRPALLIGLLLVIVAAGLEARGVELGSIGAGCEPLVLSGALVMGVALVVAGRHTIPGRMATSVAAVLLVVILLVSVSLSTVISRTVEDQALRRSGARAVADAAAAVAEGEGALDEATLVGASLSARLGPELAVLAEPGRSAPEAEAAREALASEVRALVGPDGLSIDDPVVVVSRSGAPELAVPASFGEAARLSVGGDPVVGEALASDGARQGVTVAGRSAFAVAAVPLRVVGDDGRATLGAVVVARPLDDTFLSRLEVSGDPAEYALIGRDGVIAASAGLVGSGDVRRAARAVLDGDDGGALDATGRPRVVVARPVAAEGLPPDLALVRTTSTAEVVRTREDLFRALFLVALAAGLAGIALAVLVGERIGGAIRRLTAAAVRIREGDLGAEAAIDREDELGELSTTFDQMAGSLRDLTGDLRRSAEAEGSLRARLETVFAGVTDAVVAADDERRVTELNRAAEELLGLAPGHHAVGRPLDEVVALSGADGRVLVPTASPGRPRSVSGLVARVGPGAAPSSPVPVVGTAASLVDVGGAAAGLVVVLRDVRAERALEVAKQEFLANIGHELRTPLTPIKGYAGVLRRRAPTADQAREWADGITSGVARLEHLVERLVTFAAVTAGPELDAGTGEERIEVGPLVAAVVDGWRDRLELGRVIEPDLIGAQVAVSGRQAHLRLALDELIDNAVRFSPAGAPVRVEARAEPPADQPGRGAPAAQEASTAADGHDVVEQGPPDSRAATGPAEPVAGSRLGAVRLTVRDAGGGDTSALTSAIGAFAQGDASTTRSHDGLGLGLALVDRIARAHGGRLAVDAPSQGPTAVSILLPVVIDEPGAGAPDEGPSSDAPAEPPPPAVVSPS